MIHILELQAAAAPAVGPVVAVSQGAEGKELTVRSAFCPASVCMVYAQACILSGCIISIIAGFCKAFGARAAVKGNYAVGISCLGGVCQGGNVVFLGHIGLTLLNIAVVAVKPPACHLVAVMP